MVARDKIKRRSSVAKRILFGLLMVPAALVTIVIVVVVAAFIYAPLQQPKFVNKDLSLAQALMIPALLEPRLVNGEKVFDLTAQSGTATFVDGKSTKTYGYNGNYLGPTIRAHAGDKVRLNVTNKLGEPTTTHWHGMHLPAIMDGAAHQLVAPGETWSPNWTIANEAASLWYHPHLMGKTGEQVWRGLGGVFIVDDNNSDALDLPKTYGVDDIPLVVQDRAFDAQGQFMYDGHHQDILGHTGMHGDHILVNGTYAPYVNVPAKLVRLRLVNASNARRYNFALSGGRKFQQIASDGGLLVAPVERDRLVLAPGERAEIVVDMSGQTQPVTMMSEAVHEPNTVLRFVRTILGAGRDENQRFKIIELRPQTTSLVSRPLPQKLNTIAALPESGSAKSRLVILDAQSQSLNGKQMDAKRIDEVVRAGDTEIWEVRNESGVFHPFHIHGVQFQILDRGALGSNRRAAPPVYERGWKDTVLVENAETVRLIMRFPEYADSHSPYMFHCHILEHEDMGMMGQFVVVSRDAKPEDIFVQTKLTESGQAEFMHAH